MRMRERRVYDSRVRNPEQKLVDTDAGKQICFSQQSVIGGALQLEQVPQLILVVGKAR
jgi:hypothetical protein